MEANRAAATTTCPAARPTVIEAEKTRSTMREKSPEAVLRRGPALTTTRTAMNRLSAASAATGISAQGMAGTVPSLIAPSKTTYPIKNEGTDINGNVTTNVPSTGHQIEHSR